LPPVKHMHIAKDDVGVRVCINWVDMSIREIHLLW
jgi:hypothetical protein